MCVRCIYVYWQLGKGWKTWAFLWKKWRLGDPKVLYVSESTFWCCFICLKINILVLYLSKHCIQTRNELQWRYHSFVFFNLVRIRMGSFSCWGHFCAEFVKTLQGWTIELMFESYLNEQREGVHSAFRFRLSLLRTSVLNWEEEAWKGFLCYFWPHHCSQHVSVMKATIEM